MPCQKAMESTPATLKTREKTRKYHFFPRKSIFVFLKNSTLLTIPSKVCCSLFVVRCSPSLVLQFCERIANDQQRFLDTQFLATLLPAEHPIENHARYEYRRKQIRRQTKYQSGGKPFDRPGSEDKQDGGGNDGRDVRIDDGDPGVTKYLLHELGRASC